VLAIAVDASQNVGIGTASPGTRLDVSGAARANYGIFQGSLSAFAASTGALYTYWTGSVGTILSTSDNVNTAAPMELRVGGTLGMRIDSSGNVGIGTASPGAKLDVSDGANGRFRFAGPLGTVAYADVDNFIFRSSNAVLTFGTFNGSRLDISTTAGYGLKIPATPGNTDPNTLDAYADGGTANSGGVTWTPTLAFGGASVGITYDTGVGRYTRVGNMIFAHCYIKLTSKGSSVGDATIGGLPTSANLTGLRAGAGIGNVANITFADQIFARIGANATAVTLTETTNAGAETALTDADFTATSEISFTISYPTT
jgi:hypothetical protein